MIIKHYSLNEDVLSQHSFFLLYGNNEGLKKEITEKISNNNQTYKYDEKDILNNENEFIENTKTKSLFEKNKIVIIKRVSDKILKTLERLIEKNYEDITFIIDTGSLEKRSKLRTFFEKEKKLICIAFYPDDEQTLSKLTYNHLKKRKISISPSNVNIIVSKCDGSREKLFNELEKLENFSKSGKKITTENISKLINISENHSVTELINCCLVNNNKKIVNILNENNFSHEDCILIVRAFINKAKQILMLSNIYEINKNIDLTISMAKPPIFWKDKEIVKYQILRWSPKNIRELIYKVSELELLVKKNFNNSINLITDFILYEVSSTVNS